VLGRFTTPDPLSEKYYHLSPYAYCANNPIKLIDIDGKEWADNQNNVIENTSN
jgi:RHS repeat-associated protein